ncbi:MAG TPA: CpaF family protein, partial [Phycisphaerae bacterium]|nr:CpaF family protein [Phycisphaerae bacterium]
ISEITGMEGETICMHDIFRFRQTGIDEKGCAKGQFEICGVVPRILPKLKERGAMLPPDMFRTMVIK